MFLRSAQVVRNELPLQFPCTLVMRWKAGIMLFRPGILQGKQFPIADHIGY
jgi:hypothetical protein